MEILRAEPHCLLKQKYDTGARTPGRLIELKPQVEFATARRQTGGAREETSCQHFTLTRKTRHKKRLHWI